MLKWTASPRVQRDACDFLYRARESQFPGDVWSLSHCENTGGDISLCLQALWSFLFSFFISVFVYCSRTLNLWLCETAACGWTTALHPCAWVYSTVKLCSRRRFCIIICDKLHSVSLKFNFIKSEAVCKPNWKSSQFSIPTSPLVRALSCSPATNLNSLSLCAFVRLIWAVLYYRCDEKITAEQMGRVNSGNRQLWECCRLNCISTVAGHSQKEIKAQIALQGPGLHVCKKSYVQECVFLCGGALRNTPLSESDEKTITQ